MTTFLLLLKYFFWSVLCTLLQVVFLSVTKLLLEYNFRVLFTPLPMRLQRICHKKRAPFFYKTRAITQQVLPVQTGLYGYDE